MSVTSEESDQFDLDTSESTLDARRKYENVSPQILVELLVELAKENQQFAQQVGRLDGTGFATVRDVFCTQEWVSSDAEDYEALVRSDQHEYTACPPLQEIYNATVIEALKPHNTALSSPTSMNVEHLSSVRLCGPKGAENYVDATLCPKSGAELNADTWLYVAAAVLGMDSDDRLDRECLYKAIRGSLPPAGSAKTITATTDLTGLNRCPFNSLSMMEHKTWFDSYSGILVLPILSVHHARCWKGGPYSVMILCNHVKQTAAHDVAVRIGLTRTDLGAENRCTKQDVRTAQELLTQVVKASAFCLEKKEGPDHGNSKGLWKSFKAHMNGCQTLMTTMNEEHDYAGKVPVPVIGDRTDKFIVKIDLASMGTNGKDTLAFPDPVLLAYKSSINWTRLYGFQMLAESEP